VRGGNASRQDAACGCRDPRRDDLRKTFNAINDSCEKGIRVDDLMNIMADGEKAMAARLLLRDALKGNQKGPLSRRCQQYRGCFACLWPAQSASPPRRKLHRTRNGQMPARRLNEIQAGYRFERVPQFMETRTGCFLFKCQKWGSQQLCPQRLIV